MLDPEYRERCERSIYTSSPDKRDCFTVLDQTRLITYRHLEHETYSMGQKIDLYNAKDATVIIKVSFLTLLLILLLLLLSFIYF